MALDNAAADAAVDDYLNTFDPPMTEDQKAAARPGLRPMFRALYARIVASAVVSPSGGPPVMSVGGTPVVGTGKLT